MTHTATVGRPSRPTRWRWSIAFVNRPSGKRRGGPLDQDWQRHVSLWSITICRILRQSLSYVTQSALAPGMLTIQDETAILNAGNDLPSSQRGAHEDIPPRMPRLGTKIAFSSNSVNTLGRCPRRTGVFR